jgi:carbonic anhydrase
MRLFEAIVEANHRALAGDQSASLRPAEFTQALPVVALTCIDPRLNPLMPEVLGIAEDDFIWLRNAGNIVTGPLSSTLRSLALACALKGGKEIAIIGHTDCRVRQTNIADLTARFRALGIERACLPDNLNEYFGLFASERQNVIKAADVVRSSPLIGAKIPVHGLLVDIQTGQLEWLVNGYQLQVTTIHAGAPEPERKERAGLVTARFAPFDFGEVEFLGTKLGAPATSSVRCIIGAPEQPASKPPPLPEPPESHGTTAPIPRRVIPTKAR